MTSSSTLTFRLPLKADQARDVEKLRSQLSRFLGSEMGTGKTVTAIALDFATREDDSSIRSRPTLIVCEKVGLDVWRYHLNLVGVPDSLVEVYDSSRPELFRTALSSRSRLYYVINYESMAKFDEILHKVRRRRTAFAHVIADETHLIKNGKTARSRGLKKIVTKYRTAATGTPCDDKPWDIWSILNWLDRDNYGSYWDFLFEYAKVSKEFNSHGEYFVIDGVQDGASDRIRSRIDSFFVRHMLADVEDMPELIRIDPPIWVDLSTVQTRMIRELQTDGFTSTPGAGGGDEFLFANEIVSRLQRINQISLGTPRWENGSFRIGLPSSKVEAASNFVATHSTDQLIIWTCYNDMAELLANELSRVTKTVLVHGRDGDQAARDDAVRAFQRGDAQVFVGTVGTAGKGITLNAARHVLFVDRHWNPSKNAQAIARAWRRGTTNRVCVYDILARGSFDSWRTDRIDGKAELVSQFMSGLDSVSQERLLMAIDKQMEGGA